MDVVVKPLTPETWQDFLQLFGDKGACGGCWCMWWRLPNAQFEQQKGPGNRRALRQLVNAGAVPGLIAYDGSRPIGWCSAAPREEFIRLERSRILEPVDDTPVWSVVCFFVEKAYRQRGVSRELLEATKRWVQRQGGTVLEGYPVEPTGDRVPPLFVFTGLAAAFEAAGFEECARRSPTRPIMRCHLGERES
jgi:GNAT superfamily N-acetyltransferase